LEKPKKSKIMKSKICILSLLLVSRSLLAQFTESQPDVFRLANTPSQGCNNQGGKIWFYTQLNKTIFCLGDNSSRFLETPWQGTSDIYFMGKVGISQGGVLNYELQIANVLRLNSILVNDKVGVNTLTPSEKLEIFDRDISIRSTADAKSWQFLNSDANNKFELREDGAFIMQVNYGGNITIASGSDPNLNTHKLSVDGNVNYAGSLSVEGKGTLANTGTSQLIMGTYESAIPSGVGVPANSCITFFFVFNSGTFSAPPAVFFGQKLTGSSDDTKLIFSIMSVTASSATVRVCNTSSNSVGLSGNSYSCVAIGN
jgi:hypothetical protein